MALFLKFTRLHRLTASHYRLYSSCPERKGLVLGAYWEEGNSGVDLTAAATKYDCLTKGKLSESIKIAGNKIKEGQSFIFWGLEPCYQAVALVGLGKRKKDFDKIERIDQNRESIRTAASGGCRALQNSGVKEIHVEGLEDAEAAAEGSILGVWKYQEFRTKKKDLPKIQLYAEGAQSCDEELWSRGSVKADAQNLARRLSDTPANHMTPTIFAENVQNLFCNLNVDVQVHDKKWAECQKMGSFLAVARGSVEPPLFLELTYSKGCQEDGPNVLIGKGVTFDSGGISIKPSTNMDHMRADMSGAAILVATLHAIACKDIQTNLKVLLPLTENLPSGSAMKPGDVVTAMNGKTICIDNTDAEGRLILADALCYSALLKPKWILDIATLTGAMRTALGSGATGVFSNADWLYEGLEKAGSKTGDRVWRFPLWKHYTKVVTKNVAYDINNMGGGGGGACTAAAFLREFVPECVDWMHLDIASVMGPSDDNPYLHKGMTGRPTRTLIEFIEAASKVVHSN